ncbi:hypothetical protein BJP36_36330 [Moorena producens JHB]|uniref:Uncharacterized protein n=1 Tax=Moorena producens (strain JHB) TaxID=1454205 RepID=A0A9Q9UW68_MOOP1|nr:hypothetical protein [Moorena producens]WAN69558.1 hypothetical protein BJP36_36330 [Moorena producens JHB]
MGSVGGVGRWGDGEIFIKGNYPDIISAEGRQQIIIQGKPSKR